MSSEFFVGLVIAIALGVYIGSHLQDGGRTSEQGQCPDDFSPHGGCLYGGIHFKARTGSGGGIDGPSLPAIGSNQGRYAGLPEIPARRRHRIAG